MTIFGECNCFGTFYIIVKLKKKKIQTKTNISVRIFFADELEIYFFFWHLKICLIRFLSSKRVRVVFLPSFSFTKWNVLQKASMKSNKTLRSPKCRLKVLAFKRACQLFPCCLQTPFTLHLAYQETELCEDALTTEDSQEMTVAKLTDSLLREKKAASQLNYDLFSSFVGKARISK